MKPTLQFTAEGHNRDAIEKAITRVADDYFQYKAKLRVESPDQPKDAETPVMISVDNTELRPYEVLPYEVRPEVPCASEFGNYASLYRAYVTVEAMACDTNG